MHTENMCLLGPHLGLYSWSMGKAFIIIMFCVLTLEWHSFVLPSYHFICPSLKMDFWISISWWLYKSHRINSFLNLELGAIYLAITFRRVKMSGCFPTCCNFPCPPDLWNSHSANTCLAAFLLPHPFIWLTDKSPVRSNFYLFFLISSVLSYFTDFSKFSSKMWF